MDGDRFDRMTRGLLTGASRRSLLAGLIGGAAATIAGAELLEAKKKGKAKGRGKAKARSKARGKGNGNGNGGNGNGGGGDDKQVEICHCPPGNPDNCHTIRVGKKAVASHLRNHPEDTVGPCEDVQDQCLPVTGREGDVEETDDGFTLTTEGDADFGVSLAGGRLRPYGGAGYNRLQPRFQVNFTDQGGVLDDRRVEVDLDRLIVFGGATWELGTRLGITGEVYSAPADAVTGRVIVRTAVGP